MMSAELVLLNADLEQRIRARTAELKSANVELMHTARELGTTLAELAEANVELAVHKATRERIEAELRLAHRLEAVGQLAAGVAHEINTPIQYIGDSVRFLRSAFDDVLPLLGAIQTIMPRLRENGLGQEADGIEHAWAAVDGEFVVSQIPAAIERTLDGIDRVAAIVRAMKAFAHPGSEIRAPAELNDALTTAIEVCRYVYKYVADVETDFGAIPLVNCQIGELNQVFVNLRVNAAHAIEDRVAGTDGRGLIRIVTRCEEDNVVVRISDTGVGIPTDLHEKIFDPFFTTKPVGKGTGQGLTIARSIVVQHCGSLTFESTPQVGTKFELRLPLPNKHP